MAAASRTGGPVTIAIDQGTSSTKAVLVDSAGRVQARVGIPVRQTHPQPGYVEQDPLEIADSVLRAMQELKVPEAASVAGVGFSTQRESAIVWERSTGKPLSPILGWQDRRTAERAVQLSDAANRVREISGLPLDPMFSALKLGWILDEVDPDRRRSLRGDLAVGTVDSWLLWNLTGEHRIEVGNASRTQLLSLETGEWSDELLEIFDVPRACLPRVAASDDPASSTSPLFAGQLLCAVLGDSHAALYGHGVRAPGDVKATYGTGSSVMGLTERAVTGPSLVGTVAWGTREHGSVRAFEGNILSTGATLVWLAGVLGATLDELDTLARSAPDSGGVDLVPAFSGLGAPWWDERAVGIITNLNLGSSRCQLARAAFESIALQIDDVLRAVDAETGEQIARVLTDGGPSRNAWLMQLQADISGRTVARNDGADLSAIGAAHFAAAAAGAASAFLPAERTVFTPNQSGDGEERRDRWRAAVARSRYPAKEHSA